MEHKPPNNPVDGLITDPRHKKAIMAAKQSLAKHAAGKKLGERIRLLRERKGLRQIDLGKLTDKHWGTVSRWESGEGTLKMSLDTAGLLADALGVSLATLLRGIDIVAKNG
jgi:ribosome-binding protein aMBF1 (putative translation factor)